MLNDILREKFYIQILGILSKCLQNLHFGRKTRYGAMILCLFVIFLISLDVNERWFDDDFKNMSIIIKGTSKLGYCRTKVFLNIYAF